MKHDERALRGTVLPHNRIAVEQFIALGWTVDGIAKRLHLKPGAVEAVQRYLDYLNDEVDPC